MLYILSEPLFTVSPWYKIIYKGLTNELNRKRYDFKSMSEITSSGNDRIGFSFLIGTNKNWLDKYISLCNKQGIHPIVLSTHQDFSFDGVYSTVTSNLSETIKTLLSFLDSNGRTKTALYGVNSLSLTNMSILRQFASLRESEDCVYFNTGSVGNCAEQIMKDIHKYDSVISVNDFASVVLLKRLAEIGKEIFLITYGSTQLTKKYYPGLMSVSMGYENFGKAAVAVYETLRSDPSFDTITVNVKSQYDNIELGNCITPSSKETDDSNNLCDISFYSDIEINDMIRIENMLLLCDETDSEILNMLLSGLSYEDIAEKIYCALNTVKYRVKKMKENCNCAKKKDMIELIERYSI